MYYSDHFQSLIASCDEVLSCDWFIISYEWLIMSYDWLKMSCDLLIMSCDWSVPGTGAPCLADAGTRCCNTSPADTWPRAEDVPSVS